MTRVLGPGSLAIGEVGTTRQFAGDITKVNLNATTNSEDDTPLLDGTNESGADTYAYTLTGTIMDKYTLDSLTVWCETNKGTELPFVFTPSNDGELEVSGTVKIRPVGLGGDVKKKNTNDFEFPLIGDPTYA